MSSNYKSNITFLNTMYKYRDDVSIADVAFEADGNTLEELFSECAKALTNSMIENMESIENKKTYEIKITADNKEKLLHDFLDELVYYKDAELLIFGSYEIKIDEDTLYAKIAGEEINTKKHRMIVDVKAVSWHMFSLKNVGIWKAFVILDV